jgi:hypothetical protein
MQPEIYNDELFFKIIDLVKQYNPKHILEIGSGAGQGSTQAFIKGAQNIPDVVCFYCIEARKERFEKLHELESIYRNLYAYNVSSVPISEYMGDVEIEAFYNGHPDMHNIRKFSLEEIKLWRQNELHEIIESGIQQDGIDIIRNEHKINTFDMVLIDGSPFTAAKELKKNIGAKVIILDDTVDIKNFGNCEALKMNPEYKMIAENSTLRNGYSVFAKV